MDTVHSLDTKPWISKHKIRLRDRIELRAKQLSDNNVELDICDNYTDYERTLIEELDKFSRDNEKKVKDCFLFNTTDERKLVVDDGCTLKTFQKQLEHARLMLSDQAYKVNYLLSLKTTRKELLMRHLALMNRPTNDDVSSDHTHDLSTKAIVVIQVWRQPVRASKVKLAKEILFKSDQSLTELRDQIKCQRDYGVPMDLSENPEQAERVFRGELFKSSFFLIGDTFYNDLRDPNNFDLSAEIIDWASQEVVIVNEVGENVRTTRGIGPFKSKRMEECKFEDLEFRLGCPYLYLHQGDCEHLFTISDVRYTTNNLKLHQTKFPFPTAITIGSKVDHIRCYMCKSRPPHWYTRRNARLPVDPYFFCDDCFYAFNYDSNKKKIGQFQAYLYTSTYGIPENVII